MPEIIGRYVTVFIPGEDKILALCEVEVYGTSVLGKSLEFSFPTFNFIVFQMMRIHHQNRNRGVQACLFTSSSPPEFLCFLVVIDKITMASKLKTFVYVYVRKLIECRCYGPAVMSSRCCDVDLWGKVKKM